RHTRCLSDWSSDVALPILPAFRVKQDVLPGRYTILWFTATAPGEYDLFCAEYCGTDHSRMLGKIVVLEPAQYQRWLEAHNAEPKIGRASCRESGERAVGSE